MFEIPVNTMAPEMSNEKKLITVLHILTHSYIHTPGTEQKISNPVRGDNSGFISDKNVFVKGRILWLE